MKTYKCFDERTERDALLIRVETPCQCLGCFFLDEETGDCHSPMPIDLGDDCIESIDGYKKQHYQFKEVHECFHCNHLMNDEEYESAIDCGCPSCRHKIKDL